LTSVTIGSGVTSIGLEEFLWCTKLTSITFKNTTDWKVGYTTANTEIVNIDSSNLSGTSTVKTYLKSTYRYYYWKRG
jgi:hypothetical protein